MPLRFFNTLTRTVEEFIPRDAAGKTAGVYCCGPTVHDFAHIGNFRTFVFADLVRRYLEFRDFKVRHVMNITDVEDKIIKRVHENKTSLRDYTGKYEAAFLEDFKALNCLVPHETPHATEHIADIIGLIEKLMARGVAYRTADGSVYFSIEKYQACGCQYGRLQKLNFEEMRPGERVSSDEYGKDAAADFALWKARVPEDGDIFWSSPWGEGRPGWHIECSAMSMKALGPSFDLHLGGEDLIFPHHEDEIAQSEGAGVQRAGEPFVKYWLHGAHLLVEGKKMSKSLGNYFTLRDLLAKGFTGREVRYLLLQAHYRESFNFTIEGLHGARTALGRIEECLKKMNEYFDHSAGLTIKNAPREYVQPDLALIKGIEEALDDDFNVSKVWALVFEWVRNLNRLISHEDLSQDHAKSAIATWNLLDESLFGLTIRPRTALRMSETKGVVPYGTLHSFVGEEDPPPEIRRLFESRQVARQAKNFKLSDAIREELRARGWIVEDTPKGPRLKRA